MARRDWMIDRTGDMVAGPADDASLERGDMIGLSLREGRWSIRCRREAMSPPAIATLFFTLLDEPQRPVVVSWFDGVWHLAHTATVQAAISFLSYAAEAIPTVADQEPRILTRPSTAVAERWLRVARDVLGPLRSGEITPQARKTLDVCFRGRWLVAAIGNPNGGIETVARGEGYPPLDPFFSRQAAGSPRLEQLSDAHYRAWLDQVYRDVAQSGVPRFEDVDALIRWTSFGDTRTRYWRILVPLGDIAGSSRVLTASGNDSSIDLRRPTTSSGTNVRKGLTG